MKVPNFLASSESNYVSLSRLQNEGSQHRMCSVVPGSKSIKATE